MEKSESRSESDPVRPFICYAMPCQAMPWEASQWLVFMLPQSLLASHAMPCRAQERLRKLRVSVMLGRLPAKVSPGEASRWLVSNAPQVSPGMAWHAMPCHATPCHAQERLRKFGVGVTFGRLPASVFRGWLRNGSFLLFLSLS